MFSQVRVCSRGGGYSPPRMGMSREVDTRLPPDTWDTKGYGQQAGGTHPTGMLSC